ncbi:ImuA family protein [Roseomonas elaeocarpi]|uniref:ImuA family protein n=1 Tax=Roseomonas elaeocarpi TaxID=907779 RepID=A0ABV6JVJ9_9PROT
MKQVLDKEALRAALRRRQLRRAAAGHADGRSDLSFGEALDATLPFGRGLVGAAVHGILAADRDRVLSFAMTLAARTEGDIAWIAASHPVQTLTHGRFGLATARLLLARSEDEDELLWAAEETLRSPAVSVTLLELEGWDDAALRRLQLAAETGGGMCLCLLPEDGGRHRQASLATQWRVTDGSGGRRSANRFADPWWEVELLGARGPARRWNITWRAAAEVLVAEDLAHADREEAFAD